MLAGALVVAGAPLVGAPPAFAAVNVICVGSPMGTCDATAASIQDAIAAAGANQVDDTILVGPGTYTDGPYLLIGTEHALTLQGSGPGATTLALPPGGIEQYVRAEQATVRDLTIDMNAASSQNDAGILVYAGAHMDRVTVEGTGTVDATGIVASDALVTRSTVAMPLTDNSRALYSDAGGTTVKRSNLRGTEAVAHSGNGDLTMSRVTLRASVSGAVLDSGSIHLDNSLIDLGNADATGLLAANYNKSASPKSITADHVTIVRGGSGSVGVDAWAARPDALQSSIVTLTNSVVWGPEQSLVTEADNDGAQGGTSVARIDVSHTDYDDTLVQHNEGTHGGGGIVAGPGNLAVAPKFLAPGSDFRLQLGSPVVDKGDPGAGTSTVDRAGRARVVDGDGDGDAVRDMGAYELPDKIAPETVFTQKPPKQVSTKTVTFAFTSEPGASFRCRFDGGTWRTCTSPRERAVSVGSHTFAVRARDAAGNVDPTPATYTFRRVS